MITLRKYLAPHSISQILGENLSFSCDFEAPEACEESSDVRDEDCTKWQRDILPSLLKVTNHRTYSMQTRGTYYLRVFQIIHWLLKIKNAIGKSTTKRDWLLMQSWVVQKSSNCSWLVNVVASEIAVDYRANKILCMTMKLDKKYHSSHWQLPDSL